MSKDLLGYEGFQSPTVITHTRFASVSMPCSNSCMISYFIPILLCLI